MRAVAAPDFDIGPPRHLASPVADDVVSQARRFSVAAGAGAVWVTRATVGPLSAVGIAGWHAGLIGIEARLHAEQKQTCPHGQLGQVGLCL